MASENRTTDNYLIESLLKEGSSFSFFQTVYLLEEYLGGFEGNPFFIDENKIRLVPSLSMGFAASDVVSVKRDEETSSFTVETSFLGLYGSYSPMPAFYTEDIMWDENAKIFVKGFLDIFHHRLLSLFYKSWSKYRFYIQFKQRGADKFSKLMLSLSGLNFSYLKKEEVSIPKIRLLRFAGLLTQRPRSASGLKNILNSFFSDVCIKVKEFVGKWVEIAQEQKSALGEQNCQLGVDMSVGSRVFDRAGNIRLIVCPNIFLTFIKFLPGEDYYKQLVELTTVFLPGNIAFDIELNLPEVSEIPLKSGGIMRLGYTSRLGNAMSGERSIVFSGEKFL